MLLTLSPNTYYWPPRPEQACSLNQLALYESEGWLLQTKFDGTCGIFTVTGDGSVFKAMSRHGPMKPMVRWTPTPDHKYALADLCSPDDKMHVFVAEVLHGRVKAPHLEKNPIVLHDILVKDGAPLTGATYAHRYSLLYNMCDRYKETETHYVVNDRIWLIKNQEKGFKKFYGDMERKRSWFPEHEGVVLKNPKARLAPCTRDGSNSFGQLKCRFPTDKDGVVRRSF